MQERICPVVLRWVDRQRSLLAFRHPSGGNHFVTGPVENEDSFYNQALWDLLRKESGIDITMKVGSRYLGHTALGTPRTRWSVFAFTVYDLPETWDHQPEHDPGHVLSFFWHPLIQNMDRQWDPVYHKLLRFIRTNL